MTTGIAIVAALALALAAALAVAVRQNGPGVVDTVDRIAGPASPARQIAARSYGDHPSQKLRVWRTGAADGAARAVIVFFHGGGWTSGDPDDYGFVGRALAPAGYVVVLAGYRLREAGRYPVMLEDAAASVAAAREQAPSWGGDPDRIVLAGHSAGAYNAVMLGLDRRWLRGAGVPDAAVRGVIGLAGPYDFYPFDSPMTKAAFGAGGAGADSQPVAHVRGDAPSMLLVHGRKDTVVRPANTRALAAAAEAVGAKVELLWLPEAGHNPPLLTLARPWRRDARVLDAVTRFVSRVTEVSVPVQPGPS